MSVSRTSRLGPRDTREKPAAATCGTHADFVLNRNNLLVRNGEVVPFRHGLTGSYGGIPLNDRRFENEWETKRITRCYRMSLIYKGEK